MKSISIFALIFPLLLWGCIPTKSPIIQPSRSVAPSQFIGLWASLLAPEKKDEFTLIEALDGRRLQVSLVGNVEQSYRGIVHAAALKNNMYVLEIPLGIYLFHVDPRNGLQKAVLASPAARTAAEALGNKYKVDLGFSKDSNGDVAPDSIGSAGEYDLNHEQLVAFLNELLDQSLLVPQVVGLPRNVDKQDLAKARTLAAELNKKQTDMFISALSQLAEENSGLRKAACSEMNGLFIEGHLEATAQWGRCRLNGWHGGKVDIETGLALLSKASWFGSLDAGFEIGKAYFEGRVGSKSFGRDIGMDEIKKVAAAGHAGAKAYLANHIAEENRIAKERVDAIRNSRQWTYQTESQAGVASARTAEIVTRNGSGRLFIRADAKGPVSVFYKSGLGNCTAKCRLNASYRTIDGEHELTLQTAFDVKPHSDGWYAIVDADRSFHILRAAVLVITGLVSEDDVSLADDDELELKALSETELFEFEKLDIGSLGLSVR